MYASRRRPRTGKAVGPVVVDAKRRGRVDDHRAIVLDHCRRLRRGKNICIGENLGVGKTHIG